jgi:hypothetical protein
MSNEATMSRGLRPWMFLAGVVFAVGCGTQAGGPTSVPQAPPAPLEPTVTGHFVDEDSGQRAGVADAGADGDSQAADAAAATPPSPDGSVLVAPDASTH